SAGQSPPASGTAKRTRKRRNPWMEPMRSIPRNIYIGISIASFVLLLVAWALITRLGLVTPIFLPTPLSIVQTGYELFAQFGFLNDVIATVYRVLAGFFLAVLIGVPLSLFMGTFKPVEAFFEPMTSFLRYMPASAFIPLFILWLGIGDVE